MIYATNRKARYDYHVIKTFTAGISLLGTEVKSIRNGRISIQESFVAEQEGNLILRQAHVPEWGGSAFNHAPTRNRQLLLNKKEIREILEAISRDGMTCVPLEVTNINGKIKVQIGLVKGKKNWDKRQAIKERDVKRSLARGEA